MNCPVCDRSLAPTLSICPSCGAMMYDTVREELQTKITSGPLPASRVKAEPVPDRRPLQPARAPLPVPRRTETAGLAAQKTSPTLIEFQNKNASLPDWRLQLQNAVQQRKGGQTAPADFSAGGPHMTGNVATALKVEPSLSPEPETSAAISDPRVANAMKRINESRNAFLEREPPVKRAAVAKQTAPRPYRFDVVPTTSHSSAAAAAPAPVRDNAHPKPTLVNPVPMPAKRDTNKLPAIDKLRVQSPVEMEPVIKAEGTEMPAAEFHEIKRISIKADEAEPDHFEADELSADEIEDLASFSMRFSAALFDLIIATFAAGVLLSPLAFTSGEWMTQAGLLTFAGGWLIVSFVYMTVCLGFFGKTVGMRLFSLELVDAVENEYPTLHQAAINSAVFILSLGFLGAGFLTAFFNEERRALHDLLSGTILVKEF